MSNQRSLFQAALLITSVTMPLACNALTGVDDLVLRADSTTGGKGSTAASSSGGQGGSTSSSVESSSSTGEPDPPPVMFVDALGVTLSKISIYQGVEKKLMENGAAVSSNTPVVAGREALVRVFYSLDGSYNNGDVTARLTLGDGSAPIDVVRKLSGKSSDPTLSSTLNFDVPAAMIVAGKTFRVELLQPSTDSPGNNPKAHYPDTGFAALNVQNVGASLKIKLVPIVYKADGSNRQPDTSASQLKAYKEAFYGFYPIPEIDLSVHAPVNWQQAVSPNGAGWGELLDGVAQLRAQDKAPADVYYYGIFSPASSANQYCNNGCVAGLGMLASAQDSYAHVAIGLGFTGDIALETALHEIGHTHGRSHAPCGGPDGVDSQYPYQGASIGSWGYDLVSKKLLSPQSTKDMMAYCSPIWVSDYTFSALFKRIKLTNNAKFVYPPEVLDRVYERVLIDAEGNGTWLEPLLLHTPPSSEAVSLTVHSAEGSQVLNGQLYPYDHLEGGVLMWPESPSWVHGVELKLPGKTMHVAR